MAISEGTHIHNFAKKLWPLNRSITGEGLRQTLKIIQNIIPTLKIFEVPSGTNVFDWKVPQEWKVTRAYIISPTGQKFCDFEDNNLHLLGYSAPINATVNLKQLQDHLYSLPEQPTAIPYVTSYYEQRWGFCIAHSEREKLIDGDYQVVIESEFFDGVLNYGEILIPGETDKEIFLSTYVCHPSMANNELSGPSVLTYLTKWLLNQKNLHYSYRIVFIPETIGSITYLSKNYKELKKKVVAGFNISCIGDNRTYSYVPSRDGNSLSDDVAKHVLKWTDKNYNSYSWSDRGSDERQYCAPGIDLPIASICRSKYGAYPEYHTSLDDLTNVVTPEGLQGGFDAIRQALAAIENNVYPQVKVLCEPQLGRRGLYQTLSRANSSNASKVIVDLMSWCDGKHSLLEIAEKMDVPIWELYDVLGVLIQHNLVGTCFDAGKPNKVLC